MYNSSGNQITRNKPIQTAAEGKFVDIFCGVSDNSVDATTLHKNLMGTSYTGGNNPKDYNGNENFDYAPHKWSEQWSINHDHDYDKKGARGTDGALFNTSVIGADFKLAGSNLLTVVFNDSMTDRFRSLGTSVAFTALGIFKSFKYVYDEGTDLFHGVSDGIYEFNKNFRGNIINNIYP